MKNGLSVAFYTLGCKLNQAETEQMAHQFEQAGHKIAQLDKADICIVNTCTVTHIADRKARHIIRLIKKQNPDVFVIATGCYAERAAGELLAAGASQVSGNEQKKDLPALMKNTLLTDKLQHNNNVDDSSRRIRSFIKIQDGCQHFCSYCIVPLVRSREYCVPLPEVIEEIQNKTRLGYQEVVLTGTEIGRYRSDGIDLRGLVTAILKDTEIKRLHLSSLQPQEISDDFLNLWSDHRLCRHFHLALQSGSGTVLKRMNREYSTMDYERAVSIIRRQVPGASITTDVIVGFPGESQQEFEESYRFCRGMDFAAIHVFPYSPRKKTAAAVMQNQVDPKITKERSIRMLELAKDSSRRYRLANIGQAGEVLFENEVLSGSGIYSGLTANYIRIFSRSSVSLTNRIVPVKLVKLYKQGIWGELAQ